MARLITAGFEEGKIAWPTNGTDAANLTTVGVRSGLYCFTNELTTSKYVMFPFPNTSELYFRVAVRTYGVGAASNCYLLKFRETGTNRVALAMDQYFRAIWYSLGATKTGTAAYLARLEWALLEGYIKLATVAGRLVLKVNGDTVIDYTGDTKGVTSGLVNELMLSSDNAYMIKGKFDDVAINDTTGAVNNSWIGRGGVVPVIPVGVGNQDDFVPSAGDNYECVDEVPPDEDTTTVSSDVDATDLYEMDDLSVDVIAVNAVSWTARAKLSAASAGETLTPVLRQGGVDYTDGAWAESPDTDYDYYRRDFDLAPDGTAWDVATVNALESGFAADVP